LGLPSQPRSRIRTPRSRTPGKVTRSTARGDQGVPSGVFENGTSQPTDRVELLEAVRETLAEEVPELVEDSSLDYRKPDPDEPQDEGERPPPETKHRLDRKREYRENPRRLIIRRDARRGRPKKKRGADPPSD